VPAICPLKKLLQILNHSSHTIKMSSKEFEEESPLPNNPEISIDVREDELPQTKELGYSATTKESLSQRLWKPVALHTSLILFYSLLFAWGWETLQRSYDTQHNVVFCQ
jgi:hypothetical protein